MLCDINATQRDQCVVKLKLKSAVPAPVPCTFLLSACGSQSHSLVSASTVSARHKEKILPHVFMASHENVRISPLT